MTNVTLQALFERDYKEAGIEIPAWTPEQIHIFEGAETAMSLGCTCEYSGAEMQELALAMLYDANIPLIPHEYERDADLL